MKLSIIKSVLAAALVVTTVAGTGCASAVDADPAQAQAQADTQAPPKAAGKEAVKPEDKVRVGADPINCTASDGAGSYVCFMKYSAPLLNDYVLLDMLSADDDDQVQVTNIGKVNAVVYVMQGMRNGAQQTTLTPGQTVTLHRVDGWWPWFAIRSYPDTDVDPSQVQLQLRVNYVDPNGPRAKCFDECFTDFEGCMQGCGYIGSGTACQIGCEGYVKTCREGCINNNPPAQ